ncbi:MAG: hypothetical protein R3F11_27295 [Verrucomicrobiales bacterium]
MVDRIRDARSGGPEGGNRRRRKRRSHQPIREKRKRRRAIGFAFAAILVLALGYLGYLWFANTLRYASSEFREGVAETLSEKLGLDLTIGAMEVSGLDVRAQSIVIKGRPGSVFESATVQSARGEAFARTLAVSTWDLRTVSIYQVDARFRTPKPSIIGANEAGLKTDLPILAAGLGFDTRPTGLNARYFNVDHLSLKWGGIGIRGGEVAESNLTVALKENGTADARFTNGSVKWGRFPPLEIESANILWGPDEAKIENATLRLGEESTLDEIPETFRAEGRLVWGEGGKGGHAELLIGTDRVSLAHFLPDGLRSRFLGEMSLSARYSAAFDQPNSGKLEGSIRMGELRLYDLPFIDRLAYVFSDPNLNNLRPALATATFSSSSGTLNLSDIRIEVPGQMVIAGAITVAPDGAFQGALQVGLPQVYAAQFPGGIPEDIFTEQREGFVWASLNARGNDTEFKDDLATRLTDAYSKTDRSERPNPALPRPQTTPAPSLTPPAPTPPKKTDAERKLEDIFEALSRGAGGE